MLLVLLASRSTSCCRACRAAAAARPSARPAPSPDAARPGRAPHPSRRTAASSHASGRRVESPPGYASVHAEWDALQSWTSHLAASRLRMFPGACGSEACGRLRRPQRVAPVAAATAAAAVGSSGGKTRHDLLVPAAPGRLARQLGALEQRRQDGAEGRDGKVGGYTVKYKTLDDSTASAGKWDPGQTQANARKAVAGQVDDRLHGRVQLGRDRRTRSRSSTRPASRRSRRPTRPWA